MLGGVSRPTSRSAPQWQSSAQSSRGSRRNSMRMSAEDEFWTAAAIDAERNAAVGACPAIAFDQDVLKMVGQRDSFVLSFENKTPLKQLHYVDLHLSTDGQAWDNLRLASDMQLDHLTVWPRARSRGFCACAVLWTLMVRLLEFVQTVAFQLYEKRETRAGHNCTALICAHLRLSACPTTPQRPQPQLAVVCWARLR